MPGPDDFQFDGAEHRAAAAAVLLALLRHDRLHALHMIIGIGLLAVIAGMRAARTVHGRVLHPVEITGLYWHFVDIVWIFLFPLLYLISRH